MWGGGTTAPLVLPSPSDACVVGVACGRSQKVGVTEDGKLFMWQVRSDKTPPTPYTPPIFPQSPLLPTSTVSTTLGKKGRGQGSREITTKLITGESSAFIKKVSSGDMFYACLTGLKNLFRSCFPYTACNFLSQFR